MGLPHIRTRLWTQLLLAILLATSLSVVAEALLFYHSSKAELESIARRRATESVADCTDLLVQRGDQQLALAKSWSLDAATDRAARRGDSIWFIIDAARKLAVAGGVDAIKVYDREGLLIGSSGGLLVSSDLWKSPVTASARRGIPQSAVMTNLGDLWLVTATPIYGPDMAPPMSGILVVASQVDSETAHQLADGTGDSVAFVSGPEVLAASDASTRALVRDLVAQGPSSLEGTVSIRSADVSFVTLARSSRPFFDAAPGTSLVVATSRRIVTEAESRLLRDMLAALSAALGIAVVTASILARRITGPLRALRTALGAAGEGNLGQTTEVKGDDEIADLSRAFNLMTKRLAAAQSALRDAATRDSCTGLLNHAEFFRRLDGEIARADRENRVVSMLMIDVDDFKRLNDHHGHLAGDAVLRHVADVVRGHARLGDTVARYGGDEFAVVLFGVGSAEAVNVAERMRATVASPLMPGDPDVLSVTLSVGVASRWPWGVSARKLVEAADQALLEAKRRGRDRTVSSALRRSVAPPTGTSV